MGVAVNLDNKLIEIARTYGAAQERSLSKQIEHWAKIGRIAEENPELSYFTIKEVLLGIEDAKRGHIEAYESES